MAVLNVEILKKHVRADDFSEDDAYLEMLLQAATEAVVNETNRSIEELTEMGGGTLPAPVVHAVLLLAGHFYNQREAVSGVQMHEVPCGVKSLVLPYTRLGMKTNQ